MEKIILTLGNDTAICGTAYKRLIYNVKGLNEALLYLKGENRILLIVLFPDIVDILDVIRTVRILTVIPILVLRDLYDGREKIESIGAGADEYIQLPNIMAEAAASARALIRRYTISNPNNARETCTILQGSFLIDTECHKVFMDSREIILSRREFDLFCLLVSHPGKVFTYGQIFEQLWEMGQIPTENSLHSCIRRIRRKLEIMNGCSCSIENKWGVGYFFRQSES